MKKLPYIPDRDLYAAVMFACKMVRQDGYFNKACKIAAGYYKVNEDDVKKYVRIAQGNGQKIANRKRPPRKYKWYLIVYVPDSCDWNWGSRDTDDYTEEDFRRYSHIIITRALSESNAYNRIEDYKDGWFNDDIDEHNEILYIKEFGSKKEAEEHKKALTWKEVRSQTISSQLKDKL